MRYPHSCPHPTTTIWHPSMDKSAFEDAVGSSTTYQKTLEECHPIMCGKRHIDANPSCESCSGPQTTAPGLLGSGITMTWQSETITHRQVRLYLSPGLLRRSFSIPTEKKKMSLNTLERVNANSLILFTTILPQGGIVQGKERSWPVILSMKESESL